MEIIVVLQSAEPVLVLQSLESAPVLVASLSLLPMYSETYPSFFPEIQQGQAGLLGIA